VRAAMDYWEVGKVAGGELVVSWWCRRPQRVAFVGWQQQPDAEKHQI